MCAHCLFMTMKRLTFSEQGCFLKHGGDIPEIPKVEVSIDWLFCIHSGQTCRFIWGISDVISLTDHPKYNLSPFIHWWWLCWLRAMKFLVDHFPASPLPPLPGHAPSKTFHLLMSPTSIPLLSILKSPTDPYKDSKTSIQRRSTKTSKETRPSCPRAKAGKNKTRNWEKCNSAKEGEGSVTRDERSCRERKVAQK